MAKHAFVLAPGEGKPVLELRPRLAPQYSRWRRLGGAVHENFHVPRPRARRIRLRPVGCRKCHGATAFRGLSSTRGDHMRSNSFQGVAAALVLAALGASAGGLGQAQYFDIRGVGGSGGDSARCVFRLIVTGRARRHAGAPLFSPGGHDPSNRPSACASTRPSS